MTLVYAQVHVYRLSEAGCAGAADWRLPTIEALLSPMRPDENPGHVRQGVV
ncbi:MAG: DUF1566 domain-containing protein [Betaproteobacteria bacterium]|nr:DUF1566 domain-containing protein [Betaproteobacteria bacterium]